MCLPIQIPRYISRPLKSQITEVVCEREESEIDLFKSSIPMNSLRLFPVPSASLSLTCFMQISAFKYDVNKRLTLQLYRFTRDKFIWLHYINLDGSVEAVLIVRWTLTCPGRCDMILGKILYSKSAFPRGASNGYPGLLGSADQPCFIFISRHRNFFSRIIEQHTLRLRQIIVTRVRHK